MNKNQEISTGQIAELIKRSGGGAITRQALQFMLDYPRFPAPFPAVLEGGSLNQFSYYFKRLSYVIPVYYFVNKTLEEAGFDDFYSDKKVLAVVLPDTCFGAIEFMSVSHPFLWLFAIPFAAYNYPLEWPIGIVTPIDKENFLRLDFSRERQGRPMLDVH